MLGIVSVLLTGDHGAAADHIASELGIADVHAECLPEDKLPHLMALSCKMMRKIRFNLAFSMLLNFAAIMLAMTGILNPVVGALVHNCGSVFVIINSAFLLGYKRKEM